MVTRITGFPTIMLRCTRAPPSYSQLEPEPRFPPLIVLQYDTDVAARGNSPMNEEHDWKTASRKGIGRAGDVQVQALELALLECLYWDDIVGETEQLFFVTLAPGLRTDGPSKRQFQGKLQE